MEIDRNVTRLTPALQWGRVVEDAEVQKNGNGGSTAIELQWGRVVEDAEVPKVPPLDAGLDFASMGPRR